MLAHGERGLALVGARCRIRERPRHHRGGVHDELVERGADDRRAVQILGDRYGDRQRKVAARRHAGVPASRHDCVAVPHQEAVARVGGRRRIVAETAVVEREEEADVAAVVHVVEELPVTAGKINWLEDQHIHRVLDHAARVLGRELDVGDDRVARVVRVDLAKGAAPNLLVLADGAERHSLERWPFDTRDNEPNGLCLRGRSERSNDDQSRQSCTTDKTHEMPPARIAGTGRKTVQGHPGSRRTASEMGNRRRGGRLAIEAVRTARGCALFAQREALRSGAVERA